MRNRSDSNALATRSVSVSELKRGMGIWVWSRRPAKIVQSHGDGTYDVDYIGEEETQTRVDRNDLDPMEPTEREKYLKKPRLELDHGADDDHRRAPLRKLMDEWPISRAQMVKMLGFSPPKVDRLIAAHQLPMDVAVLVSIVFTVEVDSDVVSSAERPHLAAALTAARKGQKRGG